MDKIKQLIELIDGASHMTALTGAGISTLSGIADFRGDYNPIWDRFPQDKVFDTDYFRHNPKLFFDFLREMLAKEYEPNVAHRVLAHIENEEKLRAIVTQNIDGLHEKAGSKKVYALHGTIFKNHCLRCGKEYSYAAFLSKLYAEQVVSCHCSGIIKPDVVFYGEMLPEEEMKMAVFNASRSDLMLIAGTSLSVVPASMVPVYTERNNGKIVIINRGETYLDERAVMKFTDIEDTFSKLAEYYEVK